MPLTFENCEHKYTIKTGILVDETTYLQDVHQCMYCEGTFQIMDSGSYKPVDLHPKKKEKKKKKYLPRDQDDE